MKELDKFRELLEREVSDIDHHTFNNRERDSLGKFKELYSDRSKLPLDIQIKLATIDVNWITEKNIHSMYEDEELEAKYKETLKTLKSQYLEKMSS